MTRPLRLEFSGALYHVTSRGDGREAIFLDNEDREIFLGVLSSVCERFNWCVHAYCLMDNHYHLLIETPDANLSKGMRQLNGVFTQSFNRKHKRVGHVFQGRYKAIIVQKESYLLELARYIVLNPVRAGMVRSAKDWPWSSYRKTAGFIDPGSWLNVDWLLSSFAKKRVDATKRYRTFVCEGKKQPPIWACLKNQVFLGDDAFVEDMQRKIDPKAELREVPSIQKRQVAKALEYYVNQADSRDMAIKMAYASGGYSMQEIGDYFSLHYSRVSRIISDGSKGKT